MCKYFDKIILSYQIPELIEITSFLQLNTNLPIVLTYQVLATNYSEYNMVTSKINTFKNIPNRENFVSTILTKWNFLQQLHYWHNFYAQRYVTFSKITSSNVLYFLKTYRLLHHRPFSVVFWTMCMMCSILKLQSEWQLCKCYLEVIGGILHKMTCCVVWYASKIRKRWVG